MRLENISKRTYQHSILGDDKQVKVISLEPGKNKEIPDEVALQWLKSGEVRKYIAPEEVQAKEEALKAENEALKKELEALKAKQADKKEITELEKLKQEADALGIQYPANIGEAKLRERIEAKKAEQ